MNSKIIDCACKHEFQDKEYGHGKRVFNRASKVNDKVYTYRCTVCEREVDK